MRSLRFDKRVLIPIGIVAILGVSGLQGAGPLAELMTSGTSASPVSINNAPCTVTLNSTQQAGSCTGTFTPNPAAFVQGKTKSTSGGSMTLSYPSAVSTGNLLVGMFRTPGGTSVSDNLNGAWTEAATASDGINSLWFKQNARAGATTITVSAASAGPIRAVAAAYSGVATTNALDTATCNTGASSSVTTGNTASVTFGDLVFAGVGSFQSGMTVSAGQSDGVSATLRDQISGANGTSADEDVIASASGPQNASFALSAAPSWAACIAAFHPLATFASPSPTASTTATATATTTPTPTPSPTTGACNLNATTSNFASQFAAAQPGQTVCLASGNYGTFNGGVKSGMVTVAPASGANVTMALNFNPSAFITVTGVTLTNAVIDGASHDLTISYSTVSSPGMIHIFVDKLNQSHILIDHDTFPNSIGQNISNGRVFTDWHTNNTTNIIGVTVQNSLFTGGNMISVLIEGGAGTQVLHNEFTGMNGQLDPTGAIHSDNIFNYGDQGHNVMEYNWFHDQIDVPACGWAQWDGGHDNVFEYNVTSHKGGVTGSDGCYAGVQVWDDHNSIVAHNVFEPGLGESNTNVGDIGLGGKTSEGVGSGTIVRDNTAHAIVNGFNGGPGSGLIQPFIEDHNMCVTGCTGVAGDQGTGAGDITGSPTWAGGSAPTSYNGFKLAAGSLGTGKASDGTNMGVG